MGGEASLYLDDLEDRKKVMYEPIKLRDYQEEIMNEIEALLAFGDRAVISASMGAGKSVIIAELCRRFSSEGKNVAVLTNLTALVPQLSKHLKQMNIDHDIIKAGMHDVKQGRLVHLIMEQSFHEDKRKELDLHVDVVIKDEWHIGMTGKRYKDILRHLNPDFEIGLSATPIDKRGYLLCAKDEVVLKGTTAELIEKGYLVKPRYLVPKWSQKVDYSNVRTSGNDYSEVALREIIDTPEFTSMAIEAMNSVDAKNKQTAIYCVGIEHAESFKDALITHGYDSVAVVHSKMPDNHNKQVIEAFKKGEVKTLVSVMSLTVGFDAPNMELLVNMRPTKILRLWLQLGGRVLRLNEGKEFGEILDLGQCLSSLGFLEEPILLVPKGDRKELLKAMEEREKSIIDTIVDEKPTEVSYEIVLEKIKEIEEKKKNVKNLSINELISLYDMSSNIEEIIKIGSEIYRRTHGWIYGPARIQEIIDAWNQMLEEYPSEKALLIKSLKTRYKNIIKQGRKPYSLKFFVEWLTTESDVAYLFNTTPI